MKIHYMAQGSEEWHKVRMGKLTASHAKEIITGGKGLDTLCFTCASEILANERKQSKTTEAMRIGSTIESTTRFRFEAETGLVVDEVGFIEYSQFSGFSPDGLVRGKTALVEFKYFENLGYTRYLYDLAIPSEHYAQMQAGLFMSKYSMCYYGVYNPNFDKSFYLQEVYPDQDMFVKLEQNLTKGENLIKDIIYKVGER